MTLITTAWLADQLGAPDLRILDATWHMPHLQRDAYREFTEAHIPGAVFFDIDRIADTSVPLPHMLPGRRCSPAGWARSAWATGTASSSTMDGGW